MTLKQIREAQTQGTLHNTVDAIISYLENNTKPKVDTSVVVGGSPKKVVKKVVKKTAKRG